MGDDCFDSLRSAIVVSSRRVTAPTAITRRLIAAKPHYRARVACSRGTFLLAKRAVRTSTTYVRAWRSLSLALVLIKPFYTGRLIATLVSAELQRSRNECNATAMKEVFRERFLGFRATISGLIVATAASLHKLLLTEMFPLLLYCFIVDRECCGDDDAAR